MEKALDLNKNLVYGESKKVGNVTIMLLDKEKHPNLSDIDRIVQIFPNTLSKCLINDNDFMVFVNDIFVGKKPNDTLKVSYSVQNLYKDNLVLNSVHDSQLSNRDIHEYKNVHIPIDYFRENFKYKTTTYAHKSNSNIIFDESILSMLYDINFSENLKTFFSTINSDNTSNNCILVDGDHGRFNYSIIKTKDKNGRLIDRRVLLFGRHGVLLLSSLNVKRLLEELSQINDVYIERGLDFSIFSDTDSKYSGYKVQPKHPNY